MAAVDVVAQQHDEIEGEYSVVLLHLLRQFILGPSASSEIADHGKPYRTLFERQSQTRRRRSFTLYPRRQEGCREKPRYEKQDGRASHGNFQASPITESPQP